MQKLIIQDKFSYLVADRNFYEPLSRYKAQEHDFHEPLRRILPEGWTLGQRNLWSDVTPPSPRLPEQGWKIHLSATLAHAPAILMTVARVLFRDGVPFKFISDRMLLSLVNGKRWGRGGGGKFITVYPKDQAQCAALLEALHRVTIGYWGPYILSDRRYRDNRILHYRYGGILPVERAAANGKSVLVIQNGDGEYVDDERTPYFNLPKGVVDPFASPSDSADEGEPGVLNGGRYRIESAIVFSGSGGVYLAQDRDTSQRVLVKEGRPYTNITARGLDAVQMLKKEFRILDLVADLGVAPRPYDFFLDWEHAFLVEEYLEGYSDIRSYMGAITPALATRPGQEWNEHFYRKYCLVFARLAGIIEQLHARNIIFSDLSMANVLIKDLDDGGVDVKLIDFEAAYEEGVDLPTTMFTPGFSPQEFDDRAVSRKDDDCYGIGSLMLAALFPMNGMLSLDRGASDRYLREFERDFGLPEHISGLIRSLLGGDAGSRPQPGRIAEALARPFEVPAPSINGIVDDAGNAIADAMGRMLSYIDGVTSFERTDRLFPADPEVFETNPLNLAYGALGVAYVMHRVRGHVSQPVMDWIRGYRFNPANMSPGLFTGMSGIAWALLEMGFETEARTMIGRTSDHDLLWLSPDLFNGVAGWGMTQLRFHLATGDARYLDDALRAGRHLMDVREIDPEQPEACFWTSDEGVSASLGHGSSGVALFLLYLAEATGRSEFREVGEQALTWVLSRSMETPDGGRSWFALESVRSYTPYLRWGSSGVGRVLLRYWHVTGDERYAAAIDDLLIDCDRKYTIFPGYFFGIAGIGELCMDLARFPRWQASAEKCMARLMAGCLLFPFERDGGLAFPGDSLSRISCDLGTGSAGIALVMNRYLKRSGASFMLDEILSDWSPRDAVEQDIVRTAVVPLVTT